MTEHVWGMLPPARRTVPAMLQRQAASFGDRPLLSIAAVRWTHADAVPTVARRAAALRRAGVLRERGVTPTSWDRLRK